LERPASVDLKAHPFDKALRSCSNSQARSDQIYELKMVTSPHLGLKLKLFGMGMVLFSPAFVGNLVGGLPALPNLPESRLKRFSPAIRSQIQKAYEEAQANPADVEAAGRLGMILQLYEEFEVAAECYQRARSLEPKSFRWAYYLGVVRAAWGQDAAAVAIWREAVLLNPSYLPVRLKLAELLLSAHKLEESRQVYELLVKEVPSCARAHYGLGRVKWDMGEFASAIENYRRACELFPQFGAAYYALGLAYQKLGQPEKSLECLTLYQRNKGGEPPVQDPLLEAIQSLKVGAQHHFQEGWRLEGAGHVEQAVAEYEQALELDPNLTQAHVNLIPLYGMLGQFDKAERHYRACIEVNPSLAESHYNFGVMLTVQGRYGEASEAFRKALAINPFYADAHNNLGNVLEHEGKINEAFNHYLVALENKPNHRLAHFNLARLLQQRGRHQDAINHFLKTLAVEDEKTPVLMFALANAYVQIGDYAKAISYAKQSKQRAVALGLGDLANEIDKGLKQLEQKSLSR
jgi:tetratricopeptide (TPR) repeat protein